MPGAKHEDQPVEQVGHQPCRVVAPVKGDCQGGRKAGFVHATLIGHAKRNSREPGDLVTQIGDRFADHFAGAGCEVEHFH